MENKTIRFSKGFIPAAVLSTIVILFGVAGIFTRGINFGIDFKPGLINEIRISPVSAELTYSGNAKATVSVEKDKLEIVVSGTGAENETKSYPYFKYPKLQDIADAINADNIARMSLKSDGNVSSAKLFVNSAVSTLLGKNP